MRILPIHFTGIVGEDKRATLEYIVNKVEKNSKYDGYDISIASVGGDMDEAVAIYQYLRRLSKEGKRIITTVNGQCYSAAVTVFLGGDIRRHTEGLDLFVHSPYYMEVTGNSRDLRTSADELDKGEQKIVSICREVTGLPDEKIIELLHGDTYMTADEALSYGFATHRKATTPTEAAQARQMRMAARKKYQLFLTRNKNVIQMSKKNTKNNVQQKLRQANAYLRRRAVSLVLSDANGAAIDFIELAVDATPSVGDMATVDGQPAEGSYVMPSGEGYMFEGGVLTAITPAGDGEGEEQAPAEATEVIVSSLTKVIEAVDSLNTRVDEVQSQMKALSSDGSPSNSKVAQPEMAQARKVGIPANIREVLKNLSNK